MIGQCFYHPTPPTGEHLYVVVAPSIEESAWFLCVNVTTKKGGSETTCELLRGEHPCLIEEISVVAYAWAREFPKQVIERNIARQKLDPFENPLLLKIQQSALSPTSRLRKKFQAAIVEFLRDNG